VIVKDALFIGGSIKSICISYERKVREEKIEMKVVAWRRVRWFTLKQDETNCS